MSQIYVRFDPGQNQIVVQDVPEKFQKYLPSLFEELRVKYRGHPVSNKMLEQANRDVYQWILKMEDDAD